MSFLKKNPKNITYVQRISTPPNPQFRIGLCQQNTELVILLLNIKRSEPYVFIALRVVHVMQYTHTQKKPTFMRHHACTQNIDMYIFCTLYKEAKQRESALLTRD